jgi:hypothetical protein
MFPNVQKKPLHVRMLAQVYQVKQAAASDLSGTKLSNDSWAIDFV